MEEDEEDDEVEPIIDPFFAHKFRAALARAVVSATSTAAVTECAHAASVAGLLSPPPKPLASSPKVGCSCEKRR